MPNHDVEEAISMETNQIILALRFSCDTQATCDAFYSRLCNRKKTKNERTASKRKRQEVARETNVEHQVLEK